jgi:hypothetical protein
MDYGNPERIVCLRLGWSFWFGGVGAGAKKLFDVGVNVGFGTDSGALPGRIPGFSEHRELELIGGCWIDADAGDYRGHGPECEAARSAGSWDDCCGEAR